MDTIRCQVGDGAAGGPGGLSFALQACPFGKYQTDGRGLSTSPTLISERSPEVGASSLKLGVDYLPNASLPPAGSSSQRPGFSFLFFQLLLAHSLERAKGFEPPDPGPRLQGHRGESGCGLSGGTLT